VAKRKTMPETINALLVGGGGREHALAWRLTKSKALGQLHVTHPQNPGLAALGRAVDVPIDIKEIYRLEQYCDRHKINLVVIGPEEPLAAGMADRLRTDARAVFGPGAEGAKLEADKAWAKQLMRSVGIPTAEARTFTDARRAIEYLESRETPQVVKAAGLAKGKGVVTPASLEEAVAAVRSIMVDRVFGAAGDTVVIEERLKGPEVSVLALCDGRTAAVLDACQDHKRLLEDGRGPNTGGMGAFSPSDLMTDELYSDVQRQVLAPLMDALRRENIDFRGVIYAGLMLTPGGPKVLEFNVRFGDPECQPLMLRWQGDLAQTLYLTATGRLQEARWGFDDRAACCVVLASKGYPERPETGFEITGVDNANQMEDVTVFHAGTTQNAEGRFVTTGGRVLGVTALGASVSEARDRALAAADMIEFEGKVLRRDIGADLRAGAQ
jgi:phosphoribosylamine---glycine ligase